MRRALAALLFASSLLTACVSQPPPMTLRVVTTPEPAPTPAVEPTARATDAAAPALGVSSRRYRAANPGRGRDDPILRSAPVRRAPPQIEQIGRIEIPRIGLNHPIYEGIELKVIDHGPGHWPGTAMPGERGNTVFPGHRTTHSRPFRHIDSLQNGDTIRFITDAGEFEYSVYEKFTIRPDEVWIVNQGDGHIATILACHPPGSARYRYVVRSRLKSEPIPDATPEPTPEPTPKPTRKPFIIV